MHYMFSDFKPNFLLYIYFGPNRLTSLKADLHQNIDGGFAMHLASVLMEHLLAGSAPLRL